MRTEREHDQLPHDEAETTTTLFVRDHHLSGGMMLATRFCNELTARQALAIAHEARAEVFT